MGSYRGPVVRVPAPPGRARADLVRLVDATGLAMAWISPEEGARCVAFHVVEADGWREVDSGAAGDSLGGVWALIERDPTSCLLGDGERRVRVTVEGLQVVREVGSTAGS